MQTLSTGDLTVSRANPDETPTKTDTSETLDLLGPCIQFLTLSDRREAYCLAKGTLPAGAVVLNGRRFACLKARLRGFGRIIGFRFALAAFSMCPAASSTLGETQRACPPHCGRGADAIGAVPSRSAVLSQRSTGGHRRRMIFGALSRSCTRVATGSAAPQTAMRSAYPLRDSGGTA
jgi:hypothetical protein